MAKWNCKKIYFAEIAGRNKTKQLTTTHCKSTLIFRVFLTVLEYCPIGTKIPPTTGLSNKKVYNNSIAGMYKKRLLFCLLQTQNNWKPCSIL
jgi:hypothetical protein